MIIKVDNLLSTIVAWATDRPDILGVALVGSYAHGTARQDSDVDLVIVTQNPATYIEDRAWIEQFGTVLSCEHEDWGLVQSLRVVYDNGLEVEFGLTSIAWPSPPIDDGTARVIRDGMRVLLDKTGLLAQAMTAITNDNGR